MCYSQEERMCILVMNISRQVKGGEGSVRTNLREEESKEKETETWPSKTC